MLSSVYLNSQYVQYNEHKGMHSGILYEMYRNAYTQNAYTRNAYTRADTRLEQDYKYNPRIKCFVGL